MLSPVSTSPSLQLQSVTAAYADIRGFSPVEVVMRNLAENTAIDFKLETPGYFERWMDDTGAPYGESVESISHEANTGCHAEWSEAQ